MVNRRQLLQLSALGTASFAAPLAYSASKTTMAYNTGNPIGSTSPKDLIDNAEDLDYLMNGVGASHPNRLGVPLKSWKGMEGEHDADQIRRESEFDAAQSERASEYAGDKLERDTEFSEDQAERIAEFDAAQDNREYQFNALMEASGFEPPIPYAPGILLDRTTKTVSYLGNEYRAKGSFIPMTTSNWAVDEAKLKLIGDDSLRQDMAIDGANLSGWQRTSLAQEVSRIGHMLNAQRVNAWEKAHLAVGYSVGGDPQTWDWGPAIKAAIALCVSIGGGIVELPSIDLPIKSKSVHPDPFIDPSLSGYGISIPSGVALWGTGKTRITQGYLGTSSGDRIALVSMAGTVGAGLHNVEIVGSLSAVGLTYGLQLVNASASRVSSVIIRDTSFSSLSMACQPSALVTGRGTSDNIFMDLECVNAAIDAITVLNGPGVNDPVPTRAPINNNTFYNLTIRDARVGANNAIAMGIRRANGTKIYNLRMLRIPEGGVVIESGASNTVIYGLYAEDVGSGSGAAVVRHFHVSDGDTAGNFRPGIGNKVFGGVIKGGGRAFLHKGDHDTLIHGVSIEGATFRAVGTDNVDTAAGNVANPAINPMRVTYSDCTFDGLFNVTTGLGNAEPGLTFGHGSGHKGAGGRISKFKVGISDPGEANVYSDIAFTLNERDISTPNTTGKTIVRNCGPTLNSTLVQQNVALAGLIRPTDAAFGSFNSGANVLAYDPTSIGNEDAVAAIAVASRGIAYIPAFAYVGYPATSLLVRVRAKAVGGTCSLQTYSASGGVPIAYQTAQNVNAGGWSWYTFTIPISQLVDTATCAITLRTYTTMAGTLLVDAIKVDVA